MTMQFSKIDVSFIFYFYLLSYPFFFYLLAMSKFDQIEKQNKKEEKKKKKRKKENNNNNIRTSDQDLHWLI